MVRSVRPYLLGLTCFFTAVSAASARAFVEPPPAPTGEKPAGPEGSKSPSLPFEDPPQSFVPLHPRTVEDRQRVEAITAFSVARALEARRSWTESIALLEQGLKLDPDSVTILRKLSALNFALGKTEQGIGYSKRVLDVDPGDTETITRLVGYYNRRNDPTGAESVLKGVLANPALTKSAAGRIVAELELGKLYSGKLKQFEKAADCFAKVIEALDDKAANKLSPDDLRRVLGGDAAVAAAADADLVAAETYQEFGLVFLQAKRNELAVKAFEHGLSYEPDDPQLPLLLAETLLKLGKGDQAVERVERFLKRQPQGIEGYELLAKILTTLKREEEITPRLEKAAKNDSKNVALQYTLADRYRETGQAERAEKMYKALLAAQPTTQGFVALASSLLKRKKAEELLKVLEQGLTRPGGADAVEEIVKSATEDPTFADDLLDAGFKLLSAEPPGLQKPGGLILMQITTRTGKYEKFLPIQQLLLKSHPDPQTYKELISVLFSLKKFSEAAVLAEGMLVKYPTERNSRMLDELIRLYRLADKPEEGARIAREALKLEPNDLDAQVQLAAILSQTGKIDEAVELLKAATKKEPTNPQIGAMLGSVLTQAGRNDDALTVFKGMLEKYPNNDEVIRTARSQISIIYVNMGDYAKGEAELELLLERNPDEVGVNNDLGYLYADQGKNLEKAETMIRKAVQEEPDRPAYLDSLGWVLFKRGKAKEAVEPLEKAVKLLANEAGTDATVYEHLGDVYFQLQETAKAKSAWASAEKAALKSTPPDKRLTEIRKKLKSLDELGQVPKPSSGKTP